jgi:hypothetical protein
MVNSVASATMPTVAARDGSPPTAHGPTAHRPRRMAESRQPERLKPREPTAPLTHDSQRKTDWGAQLPRLSAVCDAPWALRRAP